MRLAATGRRVSKALGGRAGQAGMLVAASHLPRTFQRTLMPRSTLDQGVVTGMAMALDHALATLVQDGIEAAAYLVAAEAGSAEVDNRTWRRTTLALDVATIGLGFAVQSAFRQRKGETMARGAARTSGWWLSVGAFAGGTVGALQEALHALDDQDPAYRDLRSMPVGLPAGAAIAALGEFLRRRSEAAEAEVGSEADEQWHVSALRSLGLGVGFSAALSGISLLERGAASAVGTLLAQVLPGGERVWRPVGHAVAVAGLAGLVTYGMHRANLHAERGEEGIEAAFDVPPAIPQVSGGPGSHVSFDTLGKQGRRNVATVLRREWVEAVMGESGAKQPIRVFVGLESAPTEDERVALAMSDLERTGAFERSVLLVVSPTGTGYVNYVAVEAAEYFARGDIASVTLQYSERPSVMSLDRVWEGRKQNRALLEAVHARLAACPEGSVPRLVLFGESLGAHTSQDAFIHTGTAGLLDLGVDKALWIGTPYASGWKNEVLQDDRPDVDRSLVGVFNDFGELEALPPDERSELRYVMITHYDDAVTKFGLDLLVEAPDWLGDPTTRPPKVPPTESYSSPETFLLTLVDMKNSANVVPGKFEAKGHDYRADLARFVLEVFGFEATATQLDRVEHALRRSELSRKEWIDERNGHAK